MPTKYRSLHPDQLLGLVGEVTAAIRAVVAAADDGRSKAATPRARNAPSSEPHQLVHGARDLNSAMRALGCIVLPFREELFQAAKDVRASHRQKRKAAPKCGAMKASGGRCGTRLEAGQFRCPLHAQEMRRRREGSASPAPGTWARRQASGKVSNGSDSVAEQTPTLSSEGGETGTPVT